MRERTRHLTLPGAIGGTQAFVPVCPAELHSAGWKARARVNYAGQRVTNPLGAQVTDLCSALRRASVD